MLGPMRVEVTVVDPATDESTDLLLDADESTPMSDVIAEIHDVMGTMAMARPQVVSLRGHRERRDGGASRPQLFHRGAPLDPSATLEESGLKHGSLVAVGNAWASVLDEPEGVVEIRVVSGPGAGAVHRLGVGEASIGSDPRCAVVLGDPRVPPVAVIASVAVNGDVTLTPSEGAADVLAETFPHAEEPLGLDREGLEAEGQEWSLSGQLTIGDIHLELEVVDAPDAAVEDSPEAGWIDYNRPPRLLAPERQTNFQLPPEPKESQDRGIPWIMMVMPIFAGVTLALVFGRLTMLAMCLFSPIMLLGNFFQSRKHGKKTFRQQMADYRDRKKQIEEDAEQALVDERVVRRLEAPDPALALLIAGGPRARLWERRTTDPDYLAIRVGVGDLPSQVEVSDPALVEHRRKVIRTAYDVPITVSLPERGVVGIASSDGTARRLAKWAVGQIAVLQSPRDTQVYVLTDREGAVEWDWLRWVPHASPQLGQDTVVTIGVDAETNARRVAELSGLIAARGKVAPGTVVDLGPDIVVVLDGARKLRSLPGVVALLKQGPSVGIYSVCLDTAERLLPEEASAVVLATPRGLSLRQQRVTVVDDVTPDLVEGTWFPRAARALAPVRDISGGDSDSVLPTGCRLTEVMELEPLSADVIKARWSLSPRSTEAVVGISLDGAFGIDMVRDGPHGLVAGTTGAGKSELLQSIVASLAVANRPDGMTFVLVDYKGGAAFKDCVDLPHTVGMVTDLDTHLVERALVSLGAELTRREHILADAEAKDIEDYIDIRAKKPHLPDMPRLLIVIDEFASLARELPDFVTGLVNVAQRGRSLGIHLILATQRPGGVVSPEIRANTNLRIALRVTDKSESSDVIDAPDAATIAKSTPGRAYVRLGASSLVPFQSGRVGGRRPGTVVQSAEPPWIKPLQLAALAQPVPVRPKAKVADDAEITDLRVLVDAIRHANDELGLPQQHSPWLPALTQEVLLRELIEDHVAPPEPLVPSVPYAVEDLPAQQERRAAAIKWSTFSHLSIMGGPRSGRSQALRTIAASTALLTSPGDVHIYALDCGNGALLPLVDLPHCGAVVQRTQTDRVLRLLGRLMKELADRQERLATGGYADLDELRAAVPVEERLPRILFLLDRWEGFMGGLADADGGSPLENIQTLLREGASVGIHLVLAGDRQVVSSRMTTLVEDKIGLRVPDKGDYGLIGLSPRKLPDDVPEGRGFRSESALELQFALLTEDVSAQAQAAEIRRIGAEAKEEYADLPRSRRPFRVDVLPSRISFDEAWAMLEPDEQRPLWALLGVGGDELTPVGVDLARVNCAVVAGPPRTGRSTALLGVVESLLRGGAEVVLAAPRPSPLRALDGREGVRAVLTDTEISEEQLEPLMDPGGGPVVLVVDDGELLKDMEAKELVRKVLRTGADRGQALVLGGDSGEVGKGFTGWQVDAKGHQGLLISPQSSTEGELIGVRLARSSVGQQTQVGRAFANAGDGLLQTIQVPLTPEP
jgi:S-DNA-T family DNA segregation ATPase FtsK/SpoIIIE